MIYQFKIKEDDKDWDDIKVAHEDDYESERAAYSFAMQLARKESKEVRMNRKDSYQGYYYMPSNL